MDVHVKKSLVVQSEVAASPALTAPVLCFHFKLAATKKWQTIALCFHTGKWKWQALANKNHPIDGCSTEGYKWEGVGWDGNLWAEVCLQHLRC